MKHACHLLWLLWDVHGIIVMLWFPLTECVVFLHPPSLHSLCAHLLQTTLHTKFLSLSPLSRSFICVSFSSLPFFVFIEPYVRRNPDNTVTVCWNFMQQGYCRHEQCWYFHPPPHIVTLYSIFPPPVSSPLLPQVR